jgi:putative ABC transport system permease protein
MNAIDTAIHSAGNLMRRKVRTLLTAFGVAVGVMALVMLVSLAVGVKQVLVQQFQTETMLTTVVVNRPLEQGPRRRHVNPLPAMGRQDSDPLRDEDLIQLRALEGVVSVYPDFGLFLQAYPSEQSDADHLPLWICGIPDEERAALSGALVAGAFWNDGALDRAVIPSVAVEFLELKDPSELIGKTLRLKRYSRDEPHRYTIVGVVDSTKMGIRANQVLIPLPACETLWKQTRGGIWSSYNPDHLSYPRAFVRIDSAAQVEKAKTRIRNAGYQALSVSDILKAINTIFNVVEAIMSLLGAVGLVAGFFGIANTMAMCVLERTREIGILKSVGATNATVMGLFLMEAAGLGVLGGALGLSIGWLGGVLLNELALPLLEVEAEVRLFQTTGWLALGAMGFSVGVSVLAGLVPALRAARMRPVEALRYE